MADLSDWYPANVQPSPRADGAPANPGQTNVATRAAAGKVGGKLDAPGLWVLVIAGAALLLLHK